MATPRLCNILALLILLLAPTYSADNQQTKLQLCTNNETLSVQITTRQIATTTITGVSTQTGYSCRCDAAPVHDSTITREDYVHTPGIGSHKLHTEAKNWNEARKACVADGAHLAIINSRAEEAVLLNILKKSEHSIKHGLNKEEALLGIHDLYTEGDWNTIFGESLKQTGYAYWNPTYWGGQPDNFEGRQNCGALVNVGGMDDVDCRDKFAYFCELPINC